MSDSPVYVHRIGLNMDQVEALKLPPNPTKTSDSRAAKYIEQYGNSSWELDAVSPPMIASWVSEAILQFRDEVVWAKSLKREVEIQAAMADLIEEL